LVLSGNGGPQRAEDKELAMTASSFVSNARDRALNITQKLAWLGPLVARITLGVLFVSTGWGKVHSLAKVTAYFSELGIPFPGIQAPMVSFIELIGGALLVIGLGSRFAAVPLMGSMLVAILTAQRENVHGLPDLFGLVEWTYFALLLWVALAGPGKISLDHVLFSRNRAPTKSAGMTTGLSAKAI
jgi:putative oxidoreductase